VGGYKEGCGRVNVVESYILMYEKEKLHLLKTRNGVRQDKGE
jgi:hypothetical protein